jgi:hypothetical protein
VVQSIELFELFEELSDISRVFFGVNANLRFVSKAVFFVLTLEPPISIFFLYTMWLGIIIVALIVLILWHARDMGKYTIRRGIDLTGGAKHKNTDGHIRYMAAESADACQTACDSSDWCSAYTYTGDACYGVAGRDETPATGYISGYKPVYSLTAESFGDGSTTAALARAPRSRNLNDEGQTLASLVREDFSALGARDQFIRSDVK